MPISLKIWKKVYKLLEAVQQSTKNTDKEIVCLPIKETSYLRQFCWCFLQNLQRKVYSNLLKSLSENRKKRAYPLPYSVASI